jgi:hypothetical protein
MSSKMIGAAHVRRKERGEDRTGKLYPWNSLCLESLADLEANSFIHLGAQGALQFPLRRFTADLPQRPGGVLAHQRLRFAQQGVDQAGDGSGAALVP